uniref:HNH nuclease domain-containing protein n=1 Tax=Rhodosorus marinus TaxID=101924 RepID=A0A7S3AAW0_9RHOD|mmetsp:Transcript_9680/g.41566  ORF Transcript_9680/g.41566 Transcript_9680/m.41566 type:complete len:268 (+) Transcript_9680:220-1023(+)
MEFPERSKRTDIGSAVASGFVFSSSLKFGRGRSVEMCVEQRNGGSRHKTKRFRKRSAIRKPTLDIPADIGKDEATTAVQDPNTGSRLDQCPALVLNSNYQPLSYVPLSLWPWQEVVKAVYLDRVVILATYDIQVRSPSVSLELPSVIALKRYQSLGGKRPAFTRYNVFIRDNFTCQYCRQKLPDRDLTFDHVIPRSRGGTSGWENVVTACVDCNYKKGPKLIKETDLKLRKVPVEPSYAQLQSMARKYRPKHIHPTWEDYVYWDQNS